MRWSRCRRRRARRSGRYPAPSPRSLDLPACEGLALEAGCAELAAPPASGCRTHFVAVWSELDGWIVPQRNASLDHPDLLVTNHRLSNVGHLSLPVDSHTVNLVVSTLTQPESGDQPTSKARQRS